MGSKRNYKPKKRKQPRTSNGVWAYKKRSRTEDVISEASDSDLEESLVTEDAVDLFVDEITDVQADTVLLVLHWDSSVLKSRYTGNSKRTLKRKDNKRKILQEKNDNNLITNFFACNVVENELQAEECQETVTECEQQQPVGYRKRKLYEDEKQVMRLCLEEVEEKHKTLRKTGGKDFDFGQLICLSKYFELRLGGYTKR
eukprot:Pgem_evm1s15317